MPTAGRAREVVSAGVVVLGSGGRVLLVHRPKYDDWSFPKGKLDRGERSAAAAVREVEEETGLHVRLGPQLADQRYRVGTGMKTVHYWTGTTVGDTDVSGYAPNAEIDEVAWFGVDKARRRLTYAHDRDTLDEALEQPRKTRTLIVLRHADAVSRKQWNGNDRKRPLSAPGRRQAQRLVPVLAAYDVRRLVTSSNSRCVDTLVPYAEATGFELRCETAFSEEDHTPKGVRRLVRDLVGEVDEAPRSAGGLVMCHHRPVLPLVFDALGMENPHLAKGEMLVLHLKHGEVAAIERHQAG